MKRYLKFFLLALMVICIVGTNIIYAQPQFPLTAHYPGNPILGKGSPGEWDSGIVYVSQAVYLDSLFYLFYSGAIQSGMPNSVGYATSPDGFNPFTKYASNPILAGDGSGFDALDVEPGALLLEGDSLIMYYGGGFGVAVGRAASVYPFDNWVRRDTPVLTQGSALEWDTGFIHAQSVLKTGNGYLMYYTGGSAPLPAGVLTWRIGMATSTDGIQWTKYDDPTTTNPPYAESDPVLKPSTSPNWDADFVFAPSVRKTANNYEMFYTGAENPNGFGYAVSTDDIHWTKDTTNNPIYVVADDPYAVSSGGVLEGPSVVLKDSVYYVYYDYGLIVGEIGMATTVTVTAIKPVNDNIPVSFDLSQNYPNPFNPATNIEFSIPNSEFVTLKVYNILGEEVATLVSEKLSAGKYKYDWDASGLASGVYLYQLGAGKFKQTQKMLLVR